MNASDIFICDRQVCAKGGPRRRARKADKEQTAEKSRQAADRPVCAGGGPGTHGG
jgi:hypothetical protein